jgi:hypothetical protein
VWYFVSNKDYFIEQIRGKKYVIFLVHLPIDMSVSLLGPEGETPFEYILQNYKRGKRGQ